jgi:hypothetical protein
LVKVTWPITNSPVDFFLEIFPFVRSPPIGIQTENFNGENGGIFNCPNQYPYFIPKQLPEHFKTMQQAPLTPMITQKPKKRKGISRKACENCRKAHACCTEIRPCKRCAQMGIVCFDMPSKKRGRKRKFVQTGGDDSNSSEENKSKDVKEIKESPQPLKQVLPKTTQTPTPTNPMQVEVSKVPTNKEYRKAVYSILFPSSKDSELQMNLFWDLLDRMMFSAFSQKSNKKNAIRFGCSSQMLTSPGEQLMCYTHNDCIKRELFTRFMAYSKDKSTFQQNTKEDKKVVEKTTENFQGVIENCEVGVVLFNYEEGFIYGYNSKAKDILGQNEEVGKMKHWMDILCAGFLPTNWEIINKINMKVDPNTKSFMMDYISYRSKNQKVVQIDTVIAAFLESKYSFLILSESPMQ